MKCEELLSNLVPKAGLLLSSEQGLGAFSCQALQE